ncbi:qde-2-interacting protein [Grosmannia clavigera kw1407]|uniref:Qde-2-interacting protein n=1 Tax=Grosmannia clavigera (strain kw1407 / UAMH 11150) TaxID=655863 RepID=F0XQ42_GROCL|nr:qde-2-interacting protein [Grosmannia clavigera kw1407]EFX00434.1 qde-2-interacting protein [Grosmannia clavigera kw1407]
MSERTLYERVGALNLLDNSDTQVPETPVVLPLSNKHSWQAQPRNDLKCGESYRGRKISFCPWNIVTHYHEWFVGKKNGELIRPYFDATALLRCKLWDFYYVWHPANAKKDCYAIVVPTDQLEDLISRISETLDIQLSIPAGVHSVKFRVIFGDFGTPLPRFLGHALDPAAFSNMVSNMPPSNPRDSVYDMSRISPQAQTSYLRKVDGLFENHDKAQRKKNKSAKSLQRTLYQRRSWGRQTKREPRQVVLVGHGISSDLEFVKHVGFDIARDAKFLEIVDTQDMHRHLRMLPQQPDPSVGEGGWDTNGEMSDGGYPENEPEWKDEAPAPAPVYEAVYEAKVKQPKPIVKISDEEAEARWGAQEPVDWPSNSPQQAGSSFEGVEGEEDLIWL